MSEFSKERIYKILSTIIDDVYVGSTCQPLTKRLYEHKKTIGKQTYENNKFYCKMQELGSDNFYIDLVENYPCSTREELRAREGEWIRKISTLNKLIAGRDSKGYCDDNAEMLRQKTKEYKAEHKEHYKEYMKAYRETKLEEIKAHRNIYIEQNREIILEQKRQHRLENKEQLCESRKNKYGEHGQIQVECDCRCVVTKCNLTRHLKSKNHEKLMKQKNPQ